METTVLLHEATGIESAGTKELEQEDRLSDLPGDILTFILERLKLHEAARTSVLSRRWRHLFGQRSSIRLDIGAFRRKQKGSELTRDDLAKSNASLNQATRSMLSHTNQHPIKLLRIRFHLMEESTEVVRCVENAMANRQITTLQFLMYPEIVVEDCTEEDKIIYGRRFMKFFGAAPRALGGLSYLHVQGLGLSIDDMTNVLNACINLEHLYLKMCDYGYLSLLEIEHPRLTTLAFSYCKLATFQLKCVPRLTRLTCEVWTAPRNLYPVSFGYVPQLSTLILKNPGTTIHKKIQLSEFLNNARICALDLDFVSQKIWIQPEPSNLVGPSLQNLQFLCLRHIHGECELDRTMFFLEGAPLLKKIDIEVWDHTCWGDEKELTKEFMEKREILYQKKSDLSCETPDAVKHYSLKQLTIKGYQIEEKFTRYIKRVMEAAVNLELIILLDSGQCECCKFSPATRYPRTEEERILIKKQILEWACSPIKIGIGA